MKKNSLFSKKDLPYWVDTLWCLKQTTKVAVFTATFFYKNSTSLNPKLLPTPGLWRTNKVCSALPAPINASSL